MKMLEPEYYILSGLSRRTPNSLSYSILGEAGEIQTKKLTVSATDLRAGPGSAWPELILRIL